MDPIENRAAVLSAGPAREKMRACPVSVDNPADRNQAAVPIEGDAAVGDVDGDRFLK